MSINHKRNTSGLKAFAQRKSQEKAIKVADTIRVLIESREKINFNSVALRAGVTKAYLYKHLEFRERIEALREEQSGLALPKQLKREMTNTSKDILIAAKNKRIRELETANKKLKDEIAKFRGKFYDSFR